MVLEPILCDWGVKKKAPELKFINEARLAQLEPAQTIARLCEWEDLEAEAE
jgi:hypothetical protein